MPPTAYRQIQNRALCEQTSTLTRAQTGLAEANKRVTEGGFFSETEQGNLPTKFDPVQMRNYLSSSDRIRQWRQDQLRTAKEQRVKEKMDETGWTVMTDTREATERALRADGRLGGHLVTGHVDGVGRVRHVTARGEAHEIAVDAPAEVRPFLAAKGSISIDGVSLTVNTVRGAEFAVMVIPHTLAQTTLGRLRPGDEVSLEADVIARYVAAMLPGRGGGGLTEERLRELGWTDE